VKRFNRRRETNCANGSKRARLAATHFANRMNNTGDANQAVREEADERG
jgi:hypothetical protein